MNWQAHVWVDGKAGGRHGSTILRPIARKYRGMVHVSIGGKPAGNFELADNPADSGGVLSHMPACITAARFPDAESVDVQTADVPEMPIRFETTKGLATYGERMDRSPLDPTLIVETTWDTKLLQAP